MKDFIRKFIQNTITDYIVAVLIIISVTLTVLEVQAPPGSYERYIFGYVGFIITLLFVVELSLRWYISASTKAFFKEYWIDVIAVMPTVRVLRVIRALRLLRIIRLGIIISRRSRKKAYMFGEGVRENLKIIFIIFNIFILGAIGMFLVESSNSSFDSFDKTIWWSLFTLMAGEPIGGEAQTLVGKFISAFVMLGGFTFFAVFTGIVSAVMVNHLKGNREAKEMELRELKNHFVICGWNRSGKVIVKELQAEATTSCAPIVIISEMEEAPVFDKKNVNLGMIYFVRDDYTSREVLKKVQIEKARAAILLADKSKPRSDQDRDARTILAALIIEKLSPGIFTSAELLQRENQVHLAMADVEDVVVGDEYMGNLIAHSSRTWGLVKVMDELLTSTRGNQFYKTKAPAEIIGLKLKNALGIIKEKYDGIIFSIETEDIPPGGEPEENIQMVSSRRIITNPPNDYVIKEDDAIIVIAEKMPSAS